jgi:hypothetical protein
MTAATGPAANPTAPTTPTFTDDGSGICSWGLGDHKLIRVGDS